MLNPEHISVIVDGEEVNINEENKDGQYYPIPSVHSLMEKTDKNIAAHLSNAKKARNKSIKTLDLNLKENNNILQKYEEHFSKYPVIELFKTMAEETRELGKEHSVLDDVKTWVNNLTENEYHRFRILDCTRAINNCEKAQQEKLSQNLDLEEEIFKVKMKFKRSKLLQHSFTPPKHTELRSPLSVPSSSSSTRHTTYEDSTRRSRSLSSGRKTTVFHQNLRAASSTRKEPEDDMSSLTHTDFGEGNETPLSSFVSQLDSSVQEELEVDSLTEDIESVTISSHSPLTIHRHQNDFIDNANDK